MRTASGCKLFGAQQALSGISDGVILFHSVIGCNFGTMTLHVPGDMRDIRQTCTVINDNDIIFSGEDSLRKAIRNALELFNPSVLFVVSGCVSEMIGDHIAAVISEFKSETPIVYVEAAGFRGDAMAGYSAACGELIKFMNKTTDKKPNTVNLLGFGGDDYRLKADAAEIKKMLGDQIQVQTVMSCCTWNELKNAPTAELNIVLDSRAKEFAEAMKDKFAIPYEEISYPYGITGARELFSALKNHFKVDFSGKLDEMTKFAVERTGRVYSYMQSLYGMPVSVIGTGGRADGMKRFLEQELGMEVVCCKHREDIKDLEDFYDSVRKSESALIFGSSFEVDLADELEIGFVRYDYPVFDEISLTDKPFVGAEGIAAVVESILNSVLQNPGIKGALYK